MRAQVWAVPRPGGQWQIMVAERSGYLYSERPLGELVTERQALRRVRFHAEVATWADRRAAA